MAQAIDVRRNDCKEGKTHHDRIDIEECHADLHVGQLASIPIFERQLYPFPRKLLLSNVSCRGSSMRIQFQSAEGA